MKILSNKKYNELKENKKINEFLARSYKANMISLNFEKAIIQILKENCIREIEIPKSYIMNEEELVVCEIPQHNSYSIRIEGR